MFSGKVFHVCWETHGDASVCWEIPRTSTMMCARRRHRGDGADFSGNPWLLPLWRTHDDGDMCWETHGHALFTVKPEVRYGAVC